MPNGMTGSDIDDELRTYEKNFVTIPLLVIAPG
jgi:hypothetical protein